MQQNKCKCILQIQQFSCMFEHTWMQNHGDIVLRASMRVRHSYVIVGKLLWIERSQMPSIELSLGEYFLQPIVAPCKRTMKRWCYTGRFTTPIQDACFWHEFSDMLHWSISLQASGTRGC